jgi:hypothetical protein
MIQCPKCANLYDVDGEPKACPKCGAVCDRTGHIHAAQPAAPPPPKILTPPPAAAKPETEQTELDNIHPSFNLEQGDQESEEEPARTTLTTEEARDLDDALSPHLAVKEKSPCSWCGKDYVDVERHKLHCKKKPKEKKQPAPKKPKKKR